MRVRSSYPDPTVALALPVTTTPPLDVARCAAQPTDLG